MFVPNDYIVLAILFAIVFLGYSLLKKEIISRIAINHIKY